MVNNSKKGISSADDVMDKFMDKFSNGEFDIEKQEQLDDGVSLKSDFILEKVRQYKRMLQSGISSTIFSKEDKTEEKALPKKDKFELNHTDSLIILQRGNDACFVRQAGDNDIFFSTAKEKLELELKFGSRNYYEWSTYLVFAKLMKAIAGRYMLDDYKKGEFSNLPQDFIDLENRVITWYSDGSEDNVLRLEYAADDVIKITISKAEGATVNSGNIVRIRTNGSEYGTYYQEVIDFYSNLKKLEQQLNGENISEKEVSGDRKFGKRRMLSLFKH